MAELDLDIDVDLDTLGRKDLQTLAKKFGIKSLNLINPKILLF